MSPINVLITIIGFISTILVISSQLQLWQTKEYRWDRFLAARNERRFQKYAAIYLLLMVSTFVITILSHQFTFNLLENIGQKFILFFFAIQILEINIRGIYRPVFTKKIILASVIILIFILALLLTSELLIKFPALHWLLVLSLTPLITALAVYEANYISNFKKGKIIDQAKRIRDANVNLKAVGITGSYGKTSTKYFLSQLIPSATISADHRNSDISIAQDVINQLSKKSNIYISEMGAYGTGEISAIADIVKPNISLITNIGNQHIALFGSQQNILKAKWEIIDALPKKGTAILNADDEIIKGRAKRHSGKIVWYSTKEKADVYFSDIIIFDTYITASLNYKNHVERINIPLVGAGALSNLLAAITCALVLGVQLKEMTSPISKIQSPNQTMKVLKANNQSIVLDDSYSANENGVINAIRHLKKFKQSDKRIIIVPLIELGQKAKSVHTRIGRELAQTKAEILVYGTANKREIIEGGASKISFYNSPNKLLKDLKPVSKDTVILLEGRMPEKIRQYFLTISNKYL